MRGDRRYTDSTRTKRAKNISRTRRQQRAVKNVSRTTSTKNR